MDWKHSSRARLPEHLDPVGDLAPPWERHPNYERYTIGWRMGAGEDWMCLWHVFLEDLDPAYEARLAYLRRHPPAPINWAELVYDALYPSPVEDEDEEVGPAVAAERRADLLQRGLIASDIAYTTWLGQQRAVRWPWTSSETPELAARHGTRDLWFWSRQIAELRAAGALALPQIPDRWQPCASPLATGEAPSLDLRQGLLSLAQLLSAGPVTPPWRLGLSLDDFADSFDDDMGYVDAFRLWGMSAFDDREQLQRYLDSTGAPEGWREWAAEQFLDD